MGYDYSVPLTAFIAAGILALLVRWIFRPSRPRTGRPDSGPGADLGLLRPVLASVTRSAALNAKNRLSQQGIRCSVSRLEIDRYDLLVFAPDVEKAQIILDSRD